MSAHVTVFAAQPRTVKLTAANSSAEIPGAAFITPLAPRHLKTESSAPEPAKSVTVRVPHCGRWSSWLHSWGTYPPASQVK